VFKNTFTAYPVMRSAAERGNPDAITFLKLNPEPKRSIGEFPSMLAYEHEQFLAAGVGVRPVTPAFAAKIIADTKGWNSPETFKKLQKKMKGQDVLGVGRALLWGVGVPVDLENAKSLLELARNLKEEGAGQDESWATVELEERKPEPALWSLWYSLENLAQSATVDYLWALAYNNAKKPTEQRTLLAASAYLGNLQARTDYAIMEWEGNGGNPDDANGFASLTLAAKTNRNAQFLLGQAYVQGLHGTPVDLPKAIQLFQASATQGQIEAEHMLAVAYHDGVTIAQDDVAALKWVQSPAQAGFPKDQRLLAQLLQGGKAVPHDAAKALEWMQKAASNGDEAARLALANGFDGK
jgi:TPR repeat protein